MDDSDIPLKRCTKCGEEKPATPEFFCRDKNKKDGFAFDCKVCKHKRDKTYRSRPAVQEQNYIRQKAWSQQNPSKNGERKKEWARMHPDRMRDASRRFDSIHPNYNVGKYKASEQAWRRAHPEIIATHRKNRRARSKGAAGGFTAAQIQDLLQRQKYKCYYCSKRFQRVKRKYIYHVDHTFPLSRITGTDIPVNSIDYLVLACPTCNLKKHDKFPWEFPEGGKLL